MTRMTTPMFRCQQCGSSLFKLMLQPGFQGQVDIGINAHDEVVVTVNNKEFVADLMFMNNFALCADCDAIHCWDYYFPSRHEATQEKTA